MVSEKSKPKPKAMKHPFTVYRESKTPKMTQEELGEILQISTASVSRIESGSQNITPENARRFAERLKIGKEALRPDLWP